MSRKTKLAARIDSGNVEVKSKFDAEFRRFSVNRHKPPAYEDFHALVGRLHHLTESPFIITYTDPADGDLLPINNNDNFIHALSTARPMLRLLIQQKGKNDVELNGYGSGQRRPRPIISKLIPSAGQASGGVGDSRIAIGLPEDFRRVSAIIDVDIVPESQRRVKLMKNGSDRPLGFYIRDGTSICVTSRGLEKVPGVFISRLVPGGLAEGTGLLAVNDEILEVNGIEVAGKTLDQVTDMMVANSDNLIITVKPINQHNNVPGARRGMGGSSGSLAPSRSNPQLDNTSTRPPHSQNMTPPLLTQPNPVDEEAEDDEDEIQEHLEDNTLLVATATTTNNNTSSNNNKGFDLEAETAVVEEQKEDEEEEEDFETRPE